MKKVFVTGATGFLGRNILPILIDRGYEIHASYRSSPAISHRSIKWHQADLMDKKQVSELMSDIKPEYLMHLAWYVTPGKWAIAPENLDWVEISINLIKEFYKNGGRRLVSAGSGLEYDWRFGYCNEDLTPTKPATFYGICKNSLKNMIEEYSKLVGLSSVWGRVFFLYGPYENPSRLIAYVINSLLKGEEAKCSHGNQVRDFLHAYDAANALVFLLENRIEGTVNIASGEPIKLKELMQIAAVNLGKENLLRLGAIQAAPSDTDLVVADVNRLKNELGWQQKFNNIDGISDTINWWKKELNI